MVVTNETLDALFDILSDEHRMRTRYFVSRPVSGEIAYDESYWRDSVDPDGVHRNLKDEREKKLEDCREEIDYLNKLRPGRVLDVGCGFGYLLGALSPNWEKHGVEISPSMAEIAGRFAKVHLGSLEQAAYPGDHFDVVILYHVIEHLTDPESVMDEVYRILKAGGRLIVATPNFDSGCARRFRSRYRLLYPGESHVSLFTESSLRRMVNDYGFEIDKVCFPFFETRYFTVENLMRLFKQYDVSPPFYGNIMTFYCRKKNQDAVARRIGQSCTAMNAILSQMPQYISKAADRLRSSLTRGGQLWIWSDQDFGVNEVNALGQTLGAMCRSFSRRQSYVMLWPSQAHRMPAPVLTPDDLILALLKPNGRSGWHDFYLKFIDGTSANSLLFDQGGGSWDHGDDELVLPLALKKDTIFLQTVIQMITQLLSACGAVPARGEV